MDTVTAGVGGQVKRRCGPPTIENGNMSMNEFRDRIRDMIKPIGIIGNPTYALLLLLSS
jgi:hypothetical protein